MAPTLPAIGLPSLPIPGAAVTAPTGGGNASPPAPNQQQQPSGGAKRRSPLRIIVPVAFAASFATIGYFGYSMMTADPATDQGARASVIDGTAPATTAESSPLIAPINDAKTVVDQINDNAGEDELIEQLNSLPNRRGEPPVTSPPVVEVIDLTVGSGVEFRAGDIIGDDLVTALDAPAFKYQIQREGLPELNVWVDSTTGNRESFDGTTYTRVTNGVVYTTTDPAGAWTVSPDGGPTDALAALGQMVMIETVIPEAFNKLESLSTPRGELGYGKYLYEDTEIAGAAPEARIAWLNTWGFDAVAAPVPVDGFIDAMPQSARVGEILVSVFGSQEGVVTQLVIEAPSLGQTVRYTLLGVTPTPLSIDPPTNVT